MPRWRGVCVVIAARLFLCRGAFSLVRSVPSHTVAMCGVLLDLLPEASQGDRGPRRSVA